MSQIERLYERSEARLDGGAKTFEAIRKDLESLTQRTTPKPLPIWQIIVACFGMSGTILGAWWTARGELDAKANVQDVASVRADVTDQRVMLSSMKTVQEATQRDVAEIKADVKEVMRRR